MSIRKPADLIPEMIEQHGPGSRILGMDLGTRTIGLALSDAGRTIATPLETIRRTKLRADLDRIRTIVAREGIGGFVLGLPLNMDGSEGRRCQATRQFAADLLRDIDLPLAFWDERLSSFEAEEMMLSADMSRKRRAEVIDRVAAALILQGFLDNAHNAG